MNQEALERCVRDAGIEVRPVWRDETGSTNDDARELAVSGAPEWTVVAAAHQTGGKGRLGRTWTDVPGRSLLVSVILRPTVAPDRAGLVALQAAVSMVSAAGTDALRSKWPNDLVADDRKIGGILPEAQVEAGRIRHLILGVGMNVDTRPEDFPPQLRGRVSSMAAEGGTEDPATLLEAFLVSFREGTTAPGFPDAVAGRYAAVCATLGRRVRATTAEGAPLEGLAVGLDDRGGLVVERNGRRRVVAFGEVEHLR